MVEELLSKKQGIRLDIGCGGSKRGVDWVGIDMLKLPGVDIVHDLEETPWPLPDECVIVASASHVLEHINPHKGVFINVMNEIWRVMKPNGHFAFIVPYAGSHGYYQDPTHCNAINETTMKYFDPLDEAGLYHFYEPKPWKIESQNMHRDGLLEVLLRKRPDDPSYHDFLPQNLVEELS